MATFVVRMTAATLLLAAAPDAPSDDLAALDRLSPPETVVLHGDVFHVQGLDVDADFIYATSVDTSTHRGYLHKFTRTGALVGTVDLTDGPRYHPGGISLDGDSIWIPVAEYRPDSTSRIVRIDKTTLQTVSSFMVKDHIGALTLSTTRIYGGNWNSRRVYVWDRSGKILARPRNPTRVNYQDFKFVNGMLVASGIMPDQLSGAVDWLDPDSLLPRQRLPVGKMNNGLLWTREGMAVAGNKLYFLPVDGHDGRAEVYVFNLEGVKAAAVACVTGADNAGLCVRGRAVALQDSAASPG
jgi:hypothetical protein